MEENKRVCSLCLTVSRNEFHPVEEITKDVFNILLLKLDFSQTKEPAMCSNCTENIHKSFEFKSVCLYTEDRIAPFANTIDGSKIDLIEVAFLHENENAEHIDMQANAVCRFCMKCEKRDACICLDTLEEDFEREVITTCLPEINLKITNKPTICTACMESVTGYYELMTTCLDVEKNINDYRKVHGVKQGETVDLENVYRFVIWNTVGQTDTCSDVVKIKMEDGDETSVIKTEEVDINDEEANINSFQRGTKKKSTKYGQKPTNSSLTCEKCSYMTSNRFHMERHLMTHLDASKVARHVCSECGLGYRIRDSLVQHIRNAHGDPSKKKLYKCTQCSYSTVVKGNYRIHLICHGNPTENDSFRCAKCPFITLRKTALRKHVLLHMEPSVAKPFKCEDCDYRAYIKSRLQQHRLVHQQERLLYKCDQCAFQTTQKCSLRNHIVGAHMPERRKTDVLKCLSCDYQTTRKANLVTHMRVHRERPVTETFKCHICPYGTKSKTLLTWHILNHRNVNLEEMYTTEHPVRKEV